MRASFIAGLPGSGKTHLLERLRTEAIANGESVMVLDDPRTPEEIGVFFDRVAKEDPDVVLVADPNFCKAPVRQAAESMLRMVNDEVEIDWWFFRNDPAQCLINARKGSSRNVEPDIRALSREYTIPEGAYPMSVWVPK